MNNNAKKKAIAWISVAACILLALMIAVTCVMYTFSVYMDQFLGRGDRVVTDTGDDLDADYIDFDTNSKEEALANAQAVTQETAEEGIVLLKNKNNALPLDKSTKVTILGYYSWHNNMSGGEDPSTTEGAVSLGAGLEEYFDTNEAVNSIYADLGNGVYFRDENGEQLFRDCVVKVEKFKDRTDGTITVVTIPKAADYEAYADQVAAIEFIVVGYRVLEGSGVRVPLQPCAD